VKPKFFPTASAFRKWLDTHHASDSELLVGFHKIGSGKPSVTYPEALDAALCYGWIDGVRNRLDAASYVIRFTPRRPGSIWRRVNIGHVRRHEAAGQMAPAGLAAFRTRDPKKTERYSFENRPGRLAPAYTRTFKANARAWAWFEREPPWYRRTAAFWVMSAKQEATRQRRLALLIAHSARELRAPPFGPGQARKPKGGSA